MSVINCILLLINFIVYLKINNMKIKLLPIFLVLLSISNFNAQDSDYKWQFSFGTNAVDVEADTSTPIADYFNINDNWNTAKSPISMFSISRFVGNNLSVGVGASFNSISKYATGLELADITNDYFTVDAMLKYDLSDALPIRLLGIDFEPFVGVGPGWTWFDDQNGLTGNVSIGLNHWLSEAFGIMLMSEYKHNLDNIEEDVMLDEGGTMRWSLMFMIKLGKED